MCVRSILTECEVGDYSYVMNGCEPTRPRLGHVSGVRGGVAVVGACAVVTRDVQDYAIALGCPARIIRHRFPGFIRAALKRIAWWDWSHETLAERLHDLRDLDIEAFTAKYDAGPEI